MEEKIFYQDQHVLVTDSRIILNGTTYALRNVASVEMVRIHKKTPMLLGLVILVGIGLIIFASWGTKLFGALCLVGAFYWIKSLADEYSVRINSNAGFADGLVSKSPDYINTIVAAINEAIISR